MAVRVWIWDSYVFVSMIVWWSGVWEPVKYFEALQCLHGQGWCPWLKIAGTASTVCLCASLPLYLLLSLPYNPKALKALTNKPLDLRTD